MKREEINKIKKSEYQEVVNVWEASVRATHHFLKEKDIAYFKLLILNIYLNTVELRCIKNTQKEIKRLLGVANQNIEMLFIHPSYRGKSIGKTLLMYAIKKLKVSKVDVNEQNIQAVGFYKHCGFKSIRRSELDASGKPFPTLPMELKNATDKLYNS